MYQEVLEINDQLYDLDRNLEQPLSHRDHHSTGIFKAYKHHALYNICALIIDAKFPRYICLINVRKGYTPGYYKSEVTS